MTGMIVCRTLNPQTEVLPDTSGTVLRINDEVLIRNCPPISARKRFTVDQILRSPETQHELMHKNSAAIPQPLAS